MSSDHTAPRRNSTISIFSFGITAIMYNSTTVDMLQKLSTEGEYQKALIRREGADTVHYCQHEDEGCIRCWPSSPQLSKQAMSDHHAETVIDRVSRKAIHLVKKKEEIKAESIYFKSDLIEKEQWS